DPRLEGHGKPFHLVLLAKDFTGYQNLVTLVTAAHLEGYYYRPRMDKDILRERSKGLIALSACLQGEVARALLDEDIDAACRVADRKSTRLNSSHVSISYAVFCLKTKQQNS